MDATDKDALTRAFETARKDPAYRRRVDEWLAKGRSWEDVAISCAHHCQSVSLDLKPWQMPPVSYFQKNDPDSALRQPYGDPRGAREAVEILQKLLALGLSRFEPNPLQAIAEAEQRQQPVGKRR